MATTTIREQLAAQGWTPDEIDGAWKVSGDDMTPSRWIEDRERWASLKVSVRALLPHGATIRAGDEQATIRHAGSQIRFEQDGATIAQFLPDELGWADHPVRPIVEQATIETA